MKLDRLGDDLALRIPPEAVEALRLREGDEVRVEIGPDRDALVVRRAMTREEALATIQRLARPFPPGFRFSRDEANERG